jgi:hypothetical protein
MYLENRLIQKGVNENVSRLADLQLQEDLSESMWADF